MSRSPETAPVHTGLCSCFPRLVGSSPAMRDLFARLHRLAFSEASVLVQGETGTGKELVARAVHDASPRAGGPFVIVDCGAIPESLLEGELFGHAKGAFTGASGARKGVIEAADGGTLFLDEIGELPLTMQPKLLRVIESRSLRRLGEPAYRPVNVRFISATHRDLRLMVNERGFREDLYFRLSVLPITIPPLRERPADIPTLVEHFLAGTPADGFDASMQRSLADRPWPGNVRELRNFVERAVALGPTEALELLARPAPSLGWLPLAVKNMLELPLKALRKVASVEIEREYVRALLARHGRNVSAAAKAAGVDRTYLHRLIRRHDLRPPAAPGS